MRRIAFLLLLLGALAFAQDTPLAKVVKANDVTKFKLKMEMAMFGDTAVYTATVTETISKVAEDGSYTVNLTQSDFKALLFGDEASVADTDLPKMAYTFSKNGDLQSIQGDLVNEAAYRSAALWSYPLPEKPVKVGDTWEFTRKAEAQIGLVETLIKYKVEAEEPILSNPAWLISVDSKESKGTEPAQSVGKIWVDKADGSILKMDMKWINAPIPGSQAPLAGTVTYERIP